MTNKRASLVEVRKFYGRLMAAASGSSDPRLERIFGFVAREAFLTPGPWQLMVNGRYVETPSADPVYIYSNSPVALDSSRGVNCGEPYLHAAWLGAVAPQPGEDIVHIGAGAGYYTALLAMLALPGGRVHAFEIDETLACKASRNLHISAASASPGAMPPAVPCPRRTSSMSVPRWWHRRSPGSTRSGQAAASSFPGCPPKAFAWR